MHSQSFQQPTLIPTGNWPAAVYTADINGDGFPDLLYLDQGAKPGQPSKTHILLNDGKGHFTQSAVVATVGDSIAIGDFNGDGHLDLGYVVAGTGVNQGYTLAGKGDGTFAAAQLLAIVPATGRNTPNLVFNTASKLSDTGAAFLLVEDSANQQLYFFGDAYLSSAALVSGTGPVTTVDIDGDGHTDLVLQGSGGSVTVMLGDGKGGLKASGTKTFTAGSAIQSVFVKDVNLDGRPDLVAESTNGHIDVYPGNGDGTFSTTSIGGTGPVDGLTGNGGRLITVADLNHDGQLDALTATPAGISTLLGAGTTYLKLGGVYNAGPGHTSYVVADFNGDGNLDLAVDSPEGIAILYGNADGSFQTSSAYPAGAPALSAATGTFTSSGKLDVVTSTAATQGQFLRGAGDGSLAYNGFPGAPIPTTNQAGTAGLWSVVKAADFDSDGNVDLLFTADGSNANLPGVGSVPGVYLQHGDGTGNFSAPTPAVALVQFTYPASSSCSPPFDHYPGQFFGTSVVADFNEDGTLDYANRDAAAYRIMRGNDGTAANYYFHEPTLYWAGVDGAGNNVDCDAHAHDLVAVADFNNDGVPDLIFQGFKANSGALLEYSSDPQRGLPLLGDLSVDGSLTTPGQLTAPQINSVFGGVSATFNQPYFPGAITTADLDHDGNTDLLVTYANLSADITNPIASKPNYLYIWYGSGGGQFLTSAKHPVNPVRLQLSRNYYQVAIADLNADGIPDLILSDGYLISYQLGIGDGTFGAEHHILAGQGINTVAVADMRGIKANDLVIANGGAAFSNPVANHEVLAADPVVNTGGVTVLLNGVNPNEMKATLSASPEPSTYYSAYTLKATLPVGTGTITFSENGNVVGTDTIYAGSAQVAGALLVPGQYALTATYSGDANTPAASLPAATHIITRAPVTVTLASPTSLTLYYGQPIDTTFKVGVVDSTHPANGNYTLLDNGNPVAICTAIPVTQACPYGSSILLDAGPHTLSVNYLGDAVNAPGSSSSYAYTILPNPTTLSLATSANPAYAGQSVTFSSTAKGNYATPTGSVTISDGSQPLQTLTLANGSATVATTSLSIGSHTLTASYPGTIDFNPASSPSINQQVIADLTTITLTSSKNPAYTGNSITFTAAVSGNYLPPAGTVNFLDAGTLIGGGTLTPGANNTSTVTFITSSLAVGTHPITAVYAGNATFNLATSAILNQVITALDPANGSFTIAATPGSMSLGVGRTGVMTVNVVAVAGFDQTVALSCANMAPETSCIFSPSATAPVGGGNVTLQLATNAPRACGTETPYFLGSNQTPRWPYGIAAAAFFFIAIKRRRFKGLLLFAAASALMTISGCGQCTDLGTRPGDYTFQIIGVAQGGPVIQTHTVSVPLKMTIPGS